MQEACLFDIMQLPEESLRQALPKASVRVIAHLVAAYPRAIGRTLLTVLADSMSPATLKFVKDEMSTGQLPSLGQVRTAESELIKILYDQNLFPNPANS